jgi:hypothetical protein
VQILFLVASIALVAELIEAWFCQLMSKDPLGVWFALIPASFFNGKGALFWLFRGLLALLWFVSL